QAPAAPPRSRSKARREPRSGAQDRKSTRLNSSHPSISYAVFCLKKSTWITHRSIQRTDAYRTSENTTGWREKYARPVIIFFFNYEANTDQGFFPISGP